MHPIVKGFVDSINIPRESQGYLEAIQEIRESNVLSVAIRSGCRGDFQLLRPLEQILSQAVPGKTLDLFLCVSHIDTCHVFRLYQYLMDTFDSFRLLLISPFSGGFLLVPAASEIVMGARAGFAPLDGELDLHSPVKTSTLRYLINHLDEEKMWNLFESERLSEALALQSSEENRLDYICERSGLEAKTRENLAKLYLRSLLGEGIEIVRSDLEALSLPILRAEQSGALGSMQHLENFYGNLVRMTTKMEGIQQMQQVTQAREGLPTPGITEAPFEARADLLACVESPDKRFLCFQVEGLPQSDGSERIWVEK